MTATSIDDPDHHRWLAEEADRLLSFYEQAAPDDDRGGFHWVGTGGTPLVDRGKQLWINARMTHCFALAQLEGRPGAGDLVDHGLAFLTGPLHDDLHGGWFSAVDEAGSPTEDHKDAYGHAFVLLAASSAAVAGRAGATELLDEAARVIDTHFWRDEMGLSVERYERDWTGLEDYRGQNSNMHLTEACMSAYDATGDPRFLYRAVRIAGRLIGQFTAANGWRLPEHYDSAWAAALDYNRDQPGHPFRPYGSTVGHWLEWARLLVQLHELVGPEQDWMLDAATRLFTKGTEEGWDDDRGGFVYTVDWDGQPVVEDRYHWVAAEAIGAAVALWRLTGDPVYDRWNRTVWEHVEAHLLDRDGGWFHQLDPRNRPVATVWPGRPDLYHAYQATLYARVPRIEGLGTALAGEH